MTSTFESSLPPIYKKHLDLHHLDDTTVDIDSIGTDMEVEILSIQSKNDNPLTMLLRSKSGVLFSIPSATDEKGMLVERSYLLTVTQETPEETCELCGAEQEYGRSIITYRTEGQTNSIFEPVWVGVDCLAHIDKSLEKVSKNLELDTKAVSELI